MSFERIEYRLSYLQTLLNPVGGVLQFALGALSGIGGFFSMQVAPSHGVFGFLSAGLYAVSVLLLLYRSPRRRARRSIALTHDGVAFDLGDCVIGAESGPERRPGSVPYRHLSVHRGLAGVTVLRALSGHHVLVPESAIPLEKLRRMIEEGSGRGL